MCISSKFTNISRLFLISVVLFFVSSCATTNSADSRDPWEPLNRNVYSFNETMDKFVFDPVGTAYNKVTPDTLNLGITNFFKNLNQIPVIINDILQLKPEQAVNDIVRFMINSSFGIFGFFDILGSALPSGKEDFGQTLAYWGVYSGPYLVIPFLGPATVRDTVGFGIDRIFLYPISYHKNFKLRTGTSLLNYVDAKADLLNAGELIGTASIDEYEFIKNAYFEKRASQINGSESEDDIKELEEILDLEDE